MIDRRTNEDETIEQVIEDFLERLQRGERPSIEDYCQKYPALAEEIRGLLKTIEFAEDPVAMLLLYLADCQNS